MGFVWYRELLSSCGQRLGCQGWHSFVPRSLCTTQEAQWKSTISACCEQIFSFDWSHVYIIIAYGRTFPMHHRFTMRVNESDIEEVHVGMVATLVSSSPWRLQLGYQGRRFTGSTKKFYDSSLWECTPRLWHGWMVLEYWKWAVTFNSII